MEATPELGTIPPLILNSWSRPAIRSGLFLMLQIDSANTSIACMGNTKNQVQAHLREAWLAVPAAQRKERLEPLLAYQTHSDKIVTLAAERGLPQEQLPAMQGTRTDWRSDATRGAKTQLNAQASNAEGRELHRSTPDEELERAAKRLRLAQTARDAARLTYETRFFELQVTPPPPEGLRSPGSRSPSNINSASSLAMTFQAPVLEFNDTQRDALLSGLARRRLSRVTDLAQPIDLGISIDSQI